MKPSHPLFRIFRKTADTFEKISRFSVRLSFVVVTAVGVHMRAVHLVLVRSHLTRSLVVVVDDPVVFLFDTAKFYAAHCSNNQSRSNTDVHHETFIVLLMSDYIRIVFLQFFTPPIFIGYLRHVIIVMTCFSNSHCSVFPRRYESYLRVSRSG